ncbi:MAG: hypothetical protein O2779_05735 [Nanoarchaeota archaeon]|nr:hypothetical protein [Nanoarchaeota archaeon]
MSINKRGDGADLIAMTGQVFIILALLFFVSQCAQPTNQNKQLEIKNLFESQSFDSAVLGLLHRNVDGSPLRELLSSQDPLKRKSVIVESIDKALKNAGMVYEFKVYVNDTFIGEQCVSVCQRKNLAFSSEFVLPLRQGGSLAYRLELYIYG